MGFWTHAGQLVVKTPSLVIGGTDSPLMLKWDNSSNSTSGEPQKGRNGREVVISQAFARLGRY